MELVWPESQGPEGGIGPTQTLGQNEEKGRSPSGKGEGEGGGMGSYQKNECVLEGQ